MSCKAVGITLQMVSSYKTVDDSPSPWGERAGVRTSVFSTAPFRPNLLPAPIVSPAGRRRLEERVGGETSPKAIFSSLNL
jgi:hypothetical protein